MRYAELLCRTHYSFLRGASQPAELVNRAAELGYEALAITDRDGVYGIPRAFLAAKNLPPLTPERPRFKLITGAELTLKSLPRVHLLAMDRAGYGLMCRLLTASHEGAEKGNASLPWNRFVEMMSDSRFEHGRKGLIAIPEEAAYFSAGESEALEDYYGLLKDFFGDRLYLPLSRRLDGRDLDRSAAAVSLAQRIGIKIVATNDVHYHAPERRALQDVLTGIREIEPLDQVGMRLFSNGERYLKSPKEMTRLFRDFPEAISNTLEVAGRCEFSPGDLRYRYPSEWIPEGESAQSYLARQVWTGAEWRYSGKIPKKIRRQVEHELKMVETLGYADYFLTIWEIVEFAKSRKILCQGRGSAANSSICYCLGITAVDPVKMNLLFERFLSVERKEPPDIDVDFEHERREEVIQHIYEKYGRDRAGMVAAVITYGERSAVRDVTKALGTSSAPASPDDPRIAPFVEQLSGFPRHLSIHSGGFTLSADPIIETVPIEPARMEGRTVVQWDKDDLDALNLVKVDILSLGMLSALRRGFDLVNERRSREASLARLPVPPPLTIATIPPDDKDTYEMIQEGKTAGVFQIESRAQISMLGRLLPKKFYDLVVQVAIVRPGPIVGQMVHPYLRRRRKLESPKSPHPDLEPILGRTLGVPLFQEQVMAMAIKMAGFTPGEADELRRAIGAWRSSGSIEKMGQKLMDGLLRSGLPEEFVKRVFEQIKGFAEYGFPESHAISFALLAYASAYLKRHYPAEFTCALLNSQPMGFYSSHTLVEEAKRDHVLVLPLDPNESEWECTIKGFGALRIGWCVVNGLGQADAERIVAARKKRRFESLPDFLARAKLGPEVLFRLAMGDAFKEFGCSQREALWKILAHQTFNRIQAMKDAPGVQLGLFQGLDLHVGGCGRDPGFRALSVHEAIEADYASYGLSVRGHPMSGLRQVLGKKVPPTTTQTVKRAPAGRGARLAGLIIVRQRPPGAKGAAFATLEDEEGFLDLILHKEVFGKYEEVFTTSPFLVVNGRIQRDVKSVSLLVSSVEALETVVAESPSGEGGLRVRSRDFH